MKIVMSQEKKEELMFYANSSESTLVNESEYKAHLDLVNPYSFDNVSKEYFRHIDMKENTLINSSNTIEPKLEDNENSSLKVLE